MASRSMLLGCMATGPLSLDCAPQPSLLLLMVTLEPFLCVPWLTSTCRQQQEEAEAVRQVAAEAAVREQLIERAELEAAQAAEAAEVVARAAANRAKLDAFKAETIAGKVYAPSR